MNGCDNGLTPSRNSSLVCELNEAIPLVLTSIGRGGLTLTKQLLGQRLL